MNYVRVGQAKNLKNVTVNKKILAKRNAAEYFYVKIFFFFLFFTFLMRRLRFFQLILQVIKEDVITQKISNFSLS
jgi:hypothetical protein